MFDPLPLTELQATAVQLHEIYGAFIQAGFTPNESLDLVKAMITAPSEEGPS